MLTKAYRFDAPTGCFHPEVDPENKTLERWHNLSLCIMFSLTGALFCLQVYRGFINYPKVSEILAE